MRVNPVSIKSYFQRVVRCIVEILNKNGMDSSSWKLGSLTMAPLLEALDFRMEQFVIFFVVTGVVF